MCYCRPVKIAVVTCYKHPDYVRARALRAGLQANKDIETIVIKNTKRNVLRYTEVFLKVLKTRFTQRPDAYLITFRGYETLLLLTFVVWPKPIIFDELINLEEWAVDEHQKLKRGTFGARLLSKFVSWQLRRCKIIIADTDAHARYSAKVSHIRLEKYVTVPLGTDETVFKPLRLRPRADGKFQVFYYGTMLPLHGLPYVLDAAVRLKDDERIEFLIVGGGLTGGSEKTIRLVEEATARGARIVYKEWIQFEDFPKTIAESGLCVGGPFGNTVQSQFVVTGKTYQFLASAAPVLIGRNAASGALLDKVNCLSVPQGNAAAIAEAVRWAVAHPKELGGIAKNGRKLYEQKYSSAVIAKDMQKVVARLTQGQ